MDDTENPENPENSGSPEAPENTKNAEGSENSENQETPQNLENKETTEDVSATSSPEEIIPSWDKEVNDNATTATEQLKNSILQEVGESKDLEAVFDVPVKVSAVLGRAIMPVHQLLKLGRGAVIELDRRIGEAIDVYVNDLLVARGEVVVVEDKLGISMTEIIKTTHKT